MSAPLSVGIVCFPSLGGSGIVATELAVGLSLRGHRVHVIASAPPSRTLPTFERLFLHEVSVPSYPALQYAPYAMALASSLVEIASDHGLDLIHVHYAVPHAAAAYLARQVLGGAAPRVVTTLHGTDVTQIGSDPSYRSITRFTVAQSEGVTVPSEFLKSDVTRRASMCRISSKAHWQSSRLFWQRFVAGHTPAASSCPDTIADCKARRSSSGPRGIFRGLLFPGGVSPFESTSHKLEKEFITVINSCFPGVDRRNGLSSRFADRVWRDEQRVPGELAIAQARS